MTYQWRISDDASAAHHAGPAAIAPGKSTLTSALHKKSAGEAAPPSALAPPHGASAAPAADPFDFSPRALLGGGGGETDVARAGFSGAASSYPHRAAIERSFGTSLPATAYLGEPAAAASSALGAHAYALGAQVAFASPSPDLAVAAHEAAHVMQATSGVHCFGGGESYDDFEAHADAVADRVVRGQSAADLLGAGATAAPAVRYQRAVPPQGEAPQQGQSSGSSPSNAAAQGSTATPTARVRTAIATGNVATVTTVERELLAERAASNPDADLQQALTAAREWKLERIAAIRATYAPRIAAANATTSAAPPVGRAVTSGDHATNLPNAGEALETAMDGECTPLLDALMAGDPIERYRHRDAAITEAVSAAVRLHASRRALTQIGHRADAEAESRAHGHLPDPDDSWCGVFAHTQAELGSGFDSRWSENMQGESGIRSALAYQGTNMRRTWVWADGTWMRLRDYHRARGSERFYETVQRAAPAHGIQAGDLVLIDNARGTDPDHITTAVSFDGRYLTTVGGNQGAGEEGVSRSGRPFDLLANPEPRDIRQRDRSGHFIPGTTEPGVTKQARVHGVGRWSLADFERHVYRLSDSQPTSPPTPAQLAGGR